MRFRKFAATTPLLLAIALGLPALDAGQSAAQSAPTPAPVTLAPTDSLKPPAPAPAKPSKPKIAPVPRKSWMAGFGLGYGSGKPSINGVRPPAETSGNMNMRFGYAANANTVVGVEISQWSAKPETTTWTFRGAMPSITFYDPRFLPHGTFVRAGLGYGRVKADFKSVAQIYDPNLLPVPGVRPDTTAHVVNDDGFALLGAVGYEWRWRKHWGFAPQVEYMYLSAGQGLSAYVASASLQVNLYW